MSDGTPPKLGFLDDHHGNASSMRLMSAVALMTSIAFGFLSLLGTSQGRSQRTVHHDRVLIAAFAPKALQKFAEARFPSSG